MAPCHMVLTRQLSIRYNPALHACVKNGCDIWTDGQTDRQTWRIYKNTLILTLIKNKSK